MFFNEYSLHQILERKKKHYRKSSDMNFTGHLYH